MAVADLSINYDRESAVDFTSKKLQNCNGMKHLRSTFAKEKMFLIFIVPFMNLGISILYKNPAKKPPSLFSFLEPFNPEVWIYMATAYLGVSLVLFILAR